jgi:hypothetical protein
LFEWSEVDDLEDREVLLNNFKTHNVDPMNDKDLEEGMLYK